MMCRRDRKRDLVVVFGTALVTMVGLAASQSHAAWRTHHSTACYPVIAGETQFWNGSTNSMVRAAASSSHALDLSCPIVEDDSGHSKVGATLTATINHRSVLVSSYAMMCVSFEFATGGTCGNINFTTGTGLNTVTVAGGAPWNGQANYPYAYLAIASKDSSGAAASQLQGYYFSN